MIKEILVRLRGTRTQQEVADALGISRARYSHYENGRNEPDIEILNLLADFYHVSIDYLIGREDKVRELKHSYDVRLHKHIEELIHLFEREPETYKFWMEFKTAAPAKRKDMIRTWQIMNEIGQKR